MTSLKLSSCLTLSSDEARETEDYFSELSPDEKTFIIKQRSRGQSNNRRRAARRQKMPSGWYMHYFFPLPGIDTPRFTDPLPEPAFSLPRTRNFREHIRAADSASIMSWSL